MLLLLIITKIIFGYNFNLQDSDGYKFNYIIKHGSGCHYYCHY
jgi:hypothetical protein